MKKLKVVVLLNLLRLIDRVLDVDRDKPVYVVFLGDGLVEIQESGKPSKTYEL